MRFIAFDYGATSGRGITADYDGNKFTFGKEHRFENTPVYIGKSLYWDFPALFRELKTGIAALSAEKTPDCMGIDSWGVDYGLLDSTGELLGFPYHYRDGRTDGIIERVSDRVSKKELYMSTGIQLMVFNTIFQLAEHAASRPKMLDIAESLLFFPDLLNYFLTGEKAAEYTIASTGAMVNPYSKTWTTDIMEKLNIPTGILGDIVEPGMILGNITDMVAAEMGIKPFPVAVVAGHDTGSAVAAVPAKSDNYAYLSCGTWSLIGIESLKPIITEETYRLNFTNEGGIGGTYRILKNINGLWIQSECVKVWKRENGVTDIGVLDEMAAAAPGFRCFIDPDEDRFMAPGNMTQKIADYCKETEQPVPENEGQFMRCLTESLAMKYRYTLDLIEKFSGKKIDALNMVGGGCKNKNLCRFTSSAIGKPVITGPTEGTAIGNLMCQLIARGECGNLSEAREVLKNTVETTVFEPVDHSLWNEGYEKFIKVTKIGNK